MKVNLIKTMNCLFLFMLCIVSQTAIAHDTHSHNESVKKWFIEKDNITIQGNFFMYKNGKVYIEDTQGKLFSFPMASLSKKDQAFATEKQISIMTLNSGILKPKVVIDNTNLYQKMTLICLMLLVFSYLLYRNPDRSKYKYLASIIYLGALFTLGSFAKKAVSTTDPLLVTAAFAPFSSTVSTSYDASNFYVNATGIPAHTMMVGISNHGWQQQVPMPKCYVSPNHWQFTLNPVAAATPVPVSATHFTKGAIAIATNGVPIFNYHTNTGVDSYTDGQLDNFGGHCGRGDDYHYHIAPMFLQSAANLPIAYALDGYAVYGSLEPTGAAMATLDANHGHLFAGVYHYHGTATAPYMIGNMVGVVTEDANLQIIPQPQGSPVRTENWMPLNGALITSCVPNTNNGYNTSYSKNLVSGYATNYTKLSVSPYTYTFQYVTPTGTTTTNYNGQANCAVPNLAAANFIALEQNIKLFPNPATDILQINLGDSDLEKGVQSIYLYDLNGRILFKTNHFIPSLDIKNVSKGNYVVKIQFENSVVTKKLIVK
ncbi:MAG: hypothetical protein CK517_01605 [Flavobacteriales bacterium]|nr:MAG: hypothetical protein CK517_01605 [Flavobacteriales bacterium]